MLADRQTGVRAHRLHARCCACQLRTDKQPLTCGVSTHMQQASSSQAAAVANLDCHWLRRSQGKARLPLLVH